MFAGAAREAVFSRPEVIRRVNADFIPVALKAGLVNNPPGGPEGQLYREIGRSKPAPQGICVVNSAGKVLDWVLMFDDDRSIPAFLDHCLKRFAKYPDARQRVAAERYMKFPSDKLADVEDSGKAILIVERHPPGKRCPATPPLPQGTVVARVFGRALGKDGKPVADTRRQEHYVEDRFPVSVDAQEALAKAAASGTKRFRVADDLARLLVSHAYLGQLDVNPVGPPGGKGQLKRCEFWAQKVEGDGPLRVRIEGKSEAAGASRDGEGGDGRLWQHEVKLAWEGLIELRASRVRRLLLVARGSEKLRWGNQFNDWKGESDAAHLPGGHPIDLACSVRYGILGEPILADEAGPADEPPEVPEEARRQLTEALGMPFLVFREKVQEELGLSDNQKGKMARHLQGTVQETMQFFQKLERLKPEEREKELHAYRRKAHEKLSAFLKDTLKQGQLDRLRQLELQQDGTFALGRPDVGAALKLTDEQRKRFMAAVQEMQKKIEPLIKEAQAKGNPEEIRPRAMKLRKEYAGKIEAILTEAQKKRWRELLGKPFDLGD
ncbi:MAG TPA: hypothetical protein VKD72_22460 [Gemmataceae bacterium]|nr:hypothetical protein [Gemmataceae bacterium]